MNRECQPCTACCDGWVRITVMGHEAHPGHPCPHSTGSGCDDYENRPLNPCHKFQCGWIIEGSPLPDWMKPNRAKTIVIFDKLRWKGLPVDLALPVGRSLSPRAMEWLKMFAQRHGRPLLYGEQVVDAHGFTGEQNILGFGPPEFQEWIARLQETGQEIL